MFSKYCKKSVDNRVAEDEKLDEDVFDPNHQSDEIE